MAEIRSLLEKYNIVAQRDEELEIPHILYERRGLDGKVIISKNFILEYDMLLQKKYIRPEKLEESFYQFEKSFFSKYFFREDTDLKWNYYLILIIEENAEEDAVCQLENDDKFLRKLVMTVEEFDIYLGHGGTRPGDGKEDITGIDTYGEWQRNLSSLKLEGILTYSYESSKVADYIDKGIGIRLQGRPISNWDNTESKSSKYLVKQLDCVSLKKFREHCLQDNTELSLSRVNLFSGGNGSGKSSLCSAIEYAMTGEISGKSEEGTTSVKIKNREGKQEILKSEVQSKEKRELDRLWYGTTTTAYKSLLNRHFHVFNYLGLEASRGYISELEINELVKNVLFGTEVTEAEKKMQRYGKEFAGRKKTYDKQIKEIAVEIGNYKGRIEETEELPKVEMLCLLHHLGYKKYRETDIEMKDEAFLEKYSELCAQYQKTAEQLLRLCSEKENGMQIVQEKAAWQTKREKHQLYEENKEKCSNLRQKQENARRLKKEYSEKLSKVDSLYHRGEGMEGNFSNQWSFRELDTAYRQNSMRKDELSRWFKNYQNISYVQEDIAQLEGKIESQKAEIRKIRQSIEGISKEIAVQKGLKDSLDVVMQEIYSISERYINLQPDASRCPMCGADHKDRAALEEALKKHKEYAEADNRAFRLLLDSQAEKEQTLKDQTDALQEMMERMEAAQKKQSAITYVGDMLGIDPNTGSEEIENTAREELRKLQTWVEQQARAWEYVKIVSGSAEFAEYDGNLEWMEYLRKTARELIKKIERETKRIKEWEKQEQELIRQLAEEDSIFPTDRWTDFQVKMSEYEYLTLDWDIAMDMPLVQWAKEFGRFEQSVEYARDIFRKRKEYTEWRSYIEKLQKDKKELEEKSKRCEEACDIISSQKKLEDIMMDFLLENAKQIELFFKILHRSKEFGTLNINNGKISIVRNSNGCVVESSQMSTGQRMALAFSIMITLHKNAPNAPGFLMLDEPVANLDDMHVLNLIDLLRELAINGTQIIITTADKQMAKYLRRKFSFFQNEYTHYELIRKGSEKTIIKKNHYSFDRKNATK